MSSKDVIKIIINITIGIFIGVFIANITCQNDTNHYSMMFNFTRFLTNATITNHNDRQIVKLKINQSNQINRTSEPIQTILKESSTCPKDKIKIKDPKLAADEELAYQILLEHYNLQCTDVNLPIYFGKIESAGFGNIISYQTIGIHYSIYHNVPYVYANKMPDNQWPGISPSDFMRPLSNCGHYFYKYQDNFTHIKNVDMSDSPNTMSAKLPQFRHRPIMWWYQQLADFWFRPWLIFKRLLNNPRDLKNILSTVVSNMSNYQVPFIQQMNTNSNSNSGIYLLGRQLYDLQSVYSNHLKIGIHVRRGDSCDAYNKCRPLCQSVFDYIDKLKQVQARINQNSVSPWYKKPLLVYISTDDTTAAIDIQTALKNDTSIIVIYLSLDRSRYISASAGVRIENAITNGSVSVTMLNDFVLEMSMLSQMDLFIGQFFSTFINTALLNSRATQWVSLDNALPCQRGGCPHDNTRDKSCQMWNDGTLQWSASINLCGDSCVPKTLTNIIRNSYDSSLNRHIFPDYCLIGFEDVWNGIGDCFY